jgi:hypothetical protein
MEIDPTKCANCGMQATMRCAGCTGTPDYHLGDAMAIVYCGRNCQNNDSPDHKSYCHSMKRRKKLLRAATILQGALLTYRDILSYACRRTLTQEIEQDTVLWASKTVNWHVIVLMYAKTCIRY